MLTYLYLAFTDSPLEVDAVPMTSDYSPHKEISYARFLSTFGTAAVKRPEKYFNACWKNERAVLVGTFGPQSQFTWDHRAFTGCPFYLGQNRPKNQCEPITLLFDPANPDLLNYYRSCKNDYGFYIHFFHLTIP